MSVRARIDDARVLSQAGRFEGAFLELLVAVAATSRRRFPKAGDREAFEKFFASRFAEVSPFTLPGGISVNYQGQRIKIETVFYRVMRCKLVHEAGLPGDVDIVAEGVPGQVSVQAGSPFRVGMGWLNVLAAMVATAPENAGEFPDGPK